MKIKILMENRAADARFVCAHGLSIYIETAGHKILMDTGPDGRFADNAAKMGVDISDIDTAVLSHGHYDHAGGLVSFLNINDKANVYAAAGYGLPHYDENGRYIGVEPAVIDNPRITVLDGDLKIDDDIQICAFRDKPLTEPVNPYDMLEGIPCRDGRVRIYPETFTHEHYLIVRDAGKCVIFSGCSHRGIVNIATWAAEFQPDAIVGGFHLMEIQPENYDVLDRLADRLLGFNIDYYTGHCTGADQYAHLKERMGDRLRYAASGSEFEI